jgi:hypothetical protein
MSCYMIQTSTNEFLYLRVVEGWTFNKHDTNFNRPFNTRQVYMNCIIKKNYAHHKIAISVNSDRNCDDGWHLQKCFNLIGRPVACLSHFDLIAMVPKFQPSRCTNLIAWWNYVCRIWEFDGPGSKQFPSKCQYLSSLMVENIVTGYSIRNNPAQY